MTNPNLANAIVCAGYAALSAIALSLTVPAAAQDIREQRVTYGDLDLTAAAGQATLSERIHAAVKRVCRPAGYSASEALEWHRCKRQSLADADRQMGVAIARAQGSSRTGIAANLPVVRYPGGKR